MISISKRSQPTLQYFIVSKIVVSCWYPSNEQENMKDKSVRGLTNPTYPECWNDKSTYVWKQLYIWKCAPIYVHMWYRSAFSLNEHIYIYKCSNLLCFILYLLNMALFLCDIMCTEHKNFVSLVVIRRVLNLYEF